METEAHPRFLFKPRTFDMMCVTLTSSASLWTGVVKTFRYATHAMNEHLPDDALLFGGFTLMHAAYSISDVGPGELLIPFVVTESNGKQQVTRFEAESQAEAIDNAKHFVSELGDNIELWAFAREGQMDALDIISVDCGGVLITASVTIVQPFRPNNGASQFAILPNSFVTINGSELDDSTCNQSLAIVREGVGYHPQNQRWNEWSVA